MPKKTLYSLVMLVALWGISVFGLVDPDLTKSRNQKAFRHEVTVTLKLIQVFVTDEAGNPVSDLKRGDFEIYDRGKLKTITEFERHMLSLPDVIKKLAPKTVLPDKVESPPGKAVADRKEPEAVPHPSKMNRKFILFFDFAFNNAKGLLKSKEAALYFMDTVLRPEDEVAVLSYSVVHGLTVHEYFTANHDKARAVIEGFGAKEIAGRAHNVELMYWIGEGGIGEYPFADGGKGFGSLDLDIERKVYKEHASRFSLRMEELSKALRYIPGYKHILFFSSGISGSVMYGKPSFFGRYRTPGDAWGETVIRGRYEHMLKELSTSNCIAHAINTEGFDPLSHRDADTQGAVSLKRISRESGGRYYGNVADYEDIVEELQNLTGSYYVLGYYVSEKWDGRYHKLDVKVKKQDCKVHAQGGYYERKPFTEYSKLEKQLHLVDLALTEKPLFQDPIRFPLEAVLSRDKEEYTLMLQLRLEEEDLSKISGEKIEVVSLIFDETEDVVDMKREEKDFLKRAAGLFQHTSRFSIPPGRHKCRVVIRNLDTGRAAVGATVVEIPEL